MRVSSFERYAYPVGLFLLALIALEVAVANISPQHFFAGHDSGFYDYFPHELIRTSAGTWEVKTDLGFPNFQAMVTLPYALLVIAANALHAGVTFVGRFFYALELWMSLAGCYSLAWVVLRRAYPEVLIGLRFGGALVAAFSGAFNIFTAVLMMYPPSNFQFGVMMWPAVVACELYFLWFAPRLPAALLFYTIFVVATVGNPATTMLGCALVLAVYVANGLTSRRWFPKLACATGILVVATLSYVWMPAVASLLFHGAVSAPQAADPRSLMLSQQILALRGSLNDLLRFDGLIWWPRTPAADLYAAFPLALVTFVPALLGIVALRRRRPLVLVAWGVALAGIWLAKSVHDPFAMNFMWLMTHIELFAAFRQTYDKFMMLVTVALPVVAACGFVTLATSGKREQIVAGVSAACIALLAWPFAGGAIAEPYFLTTIPRDYTRVNALMGDAPEARFLSLPGAPGDINVLTWFKGANLENFLDHAGSVNASIFKIRSISGATGYDDASLEFARELPSIVGMLGMYGIDYVVLHKDYTTEYRMAFDFEPYKVLGPITTRAMEGILDRDSRVKKIYEGPNLVLYRVRPFATLPRAYASYVATTQIGFENNLLAASDAGLTAAAAHPVLLFTGNQVYPAGLRARRGAVVHAPIFEETPMLYREEIRAPDADVASASARYGDFGSADDYLFAADHGDFSTGIIEDPSSMSAHFHVRRPSTLALEVSLLAQPAAREILFEALDGRQQLDEHVSAALVDDPIMVVQYRDAPAAGAALQLGFAGPGHGALQIDEPLSPAVAPYALDVRDALQAVFDEQYNKRLARHRFDWRWRAQQPYVDPPQADGFTLKSIRLAGGGSLRLRALALSLNEAAGSYLSAGFVRSFAERGNATRGEYLLATPTVRDGTWLVRARADPVHPQWGMYAMTIALPRIDVGRYPTLRVRSWIGSTNAAPSLSIGLRTNYGTLQIVPDNTLNSYARFGSLEPSVTLDRVNDASATPGYWLTSLVDMRQIITESRSSSAVPISVTLAFTLHARARSAPTDFDFGFGDVAFLGSMPESALERSPLGTVTLDGRPLQLLSTSEQDSRSDELRARFAPTRLSSGTHRLVMEMATPWSVKSAALMSDAVSSPRAFPPVSLRHIDDELYSVHVGKGGRSAWLAFAQTYHNGWRLVAARPPRDRLSWIGSLQWLRAASGIHVVGNAYDNAWYLSAQAPQDYVLDFVPQDFAVIGEIVSTFALAAATAIMAAALVLFAIKSVRR